MALPTSPLKNHLTPVSIALVILSSFADLPFSMRLATLTFAANFLWLPLRSMSSRSASPPNSPGSCYLVVNA